MVFFGRCLVFLFLALREPDGIYLVYFSCTVNPLLMLKLSEWEESCVFMTYVLLQKRKAGAMRNALSCVDIWVPTSSDHFLALKFKFLSFIAIKSTTCVSQKSVKISVMFHVNLTCSADVKYVIGLFPGLLPNEFRKTLKYPAVPPVLVGSELEKGLGALADYLTGVCTCSLHQAFVYLLEFSCQMFFYCGMLMFLLCLAGHGLV